MVNKKTITILSVITALLIILYIFIGINVGNIDYFLPRRTTRILGIIIVALAISISTVMFQSLVTIRTLLNGSF